MYALVRLSKVPALAFVLLLAAVLPAAARTSESYGYVSVLDGTATIVQASSRDSGSAEINQPVLAGDRLRLSSRTRMEVVLADGNLLRLDGGTEILLDRLAGSPDTGDRRTVLRLLEGNLLLVVDRDALGDDLPRIETGNATVTIEYPGTFRITAESDGWTQVVARRGSARVDFEAGSERVRAGEELVVDEGDRYPAETEEAGGLDSLERWASRLDSDYDDDPRYIEDEGLRYAARPLSRYGAWVTISGRPYWRPTGIGADWRPYWQGRWAYTPSGLTWVSYEPWGWVPYHYGSWDYVLGYGWVWSPGYTYAPAHVYWYWGNDYVGWCPTGYYTRYYGGLHASFRFGVYGWSHGGWDHYRNWNFVRHDHFGGRDQQRYAVPVDQFGRGGQGSPGRGVITTDTRPLKPELWRKPIEAVNTLSGWQAVDNGGRTAPGKGPRELPDVTAFIGRKPQLTPTELKPLVAGNGQVSLDSGWSKPVASERPATPGKPRWTEREPEVTNKPGVRESNGGSWNDRRPRQVEIPAAGQDDSGDSTPGWRKPAGERPVVEKPAERKPAERKPREAPPAESPRWSKPQDEEPVEPPVWNKPGRQVESERPRYRQPATEDTPRGGEDPAPGAGSWRNREPERTSRPPQTWSKPAPSGDSGSGYRGSRPTYERPSPPPTERRPESSQPPRGGSSGGSSSAGSSSGGSSSGSGSWSKPAPSGSGSREAAPRKPAGGGGEGGGNKGRARATRPPADGDGDGGR